MIQRIFILLFRKSFLLKNNPKKYYREFLGPLFEEYKKGYLKYYWRVKDERL